MNTIPSQIPRSLGRVPAWREEGSRALAQVAMNDFPTAADAFFELIDNPLDYRRGGHLEIALTVDRDHDLIVIEDIGGEGMDSAGIADWLRWGSGHSHDRADIGMYHKGGKAACGYLARSVRITTRRKGTTDVWRLEDRDWSRRTDWMNFGRPQPYRGPLPVHVAQLPRDAGFTRVELFGVETDRRYDLKRLRWRIGSTYRRLIASSAVTVRLNGEPVPALELPLSSAFKRADFTLTLTSGRKVRGWVGRLDRDRLAGTTFRTQGGLRCLYQGRLISEGEYFGHNAEGRGSLAALIGEVELNHLRPLSNKTDFQRDTAAWLEVEAAMHTWLGPIVAEFRRASDTQPVSREERKRLNEVRRQLSAVLQELFRLTEDQGSGDSQGRRSPAADSGAKPTERTNDARGAAASRTPPPPGAVGVLKRLRRQLGESAEIPEIELVVAEPGVRSQAQRTADGHISKLFVNKAYCLYEQLRGAEGYLAETALLEILQPLPAEHRPVADFLAEVNHCLDLWNRIAA